MLSRADEASGEHSKWFRTALNAGVKMALGSDLGPIKDAVYLEMGLWIRDGATPIQAIQAATKTAAELCGVGEDLGTVEPGKIADLIAVRENPMENINHLRNLSIVIKDGQVITNNLGA